MLHSGKVIIYTHLFKMCIFCGSMTFKHQFNSQKIFHIAHFYQSQLLHGESWYVFILLYSAAFFMALWLALIFSLHFQVFSVRPRRPFCFVPSPFLGGHFCLLGLSFHGSHLVLAYPFPTVLIIGLSYTLGKGQPLHFDLV